DQREQVGLRQTAQDFGEHALRPGKVHQPVMHYRNARGQFFTHNSPMVTNNAQRRISPALALLLWCAIGAIVAQLLIARGTSNPRSFTPIFWYLLNAYDTHGNVVLAAIALLAFLLRRAPAALGAVRFAGDHPWAITG